MYISYWDAWTVSDHPPDFHNEARLKRLQYNIFLTYTSVAACDLVAAIAQWILVKRRIITTKDNAAKRFKRSEAAPNETPKLCWMEQQCDFDIYTIDYLVIDEIDCTITFGYMLLFGVVSPLIVVECFLVLLLQMRLNSFMLCHLYRRPVPYRASGNDHAMHSNLDILAWLGLANSIAIPLFNLQRFCQTPRWQLWLMFFVTEHVCILLKYLAGRWLSKTSNSEKVVARQRAYVMRRFLEAGDEEISPADFLCEAPSCRPEDIRQIDQYSPEWRSLESEDTDFPLTVAEIPHRASENPDGGFDQVVSEGIELYDRHGSNIL